VTLADFELIPRRDDAQFLYNGQPSETEWANAIVQRTSSVCPSVCKHFAQVASSIPGKWLRPDQTQSFPNLPLSVQCSSASQSPNGCEFALSAPLQLTWWNSLSNCLLYSTVWRSVSYVRSLY